MKNRTENRRRKKSGDTPYHKIISRCALIKRRTERKKEETGNGPPTPCNDFKNKYDILHLMENNVTTYIISKSYSTY